jgi:hypothetical protein
MKSVIEEEILNQQERIKSVRIIIQGFMKELFKIATGQASIMKTKSLLKDKLENFNQQILPKLLETRGVGIDEITKQKLSQLDNYGDLMKQIEYLKKEITNFQKQIDQEKAQYTNKILIGINKNKNLVEECNKLQEENVYFIRLLLELKNTIKESRGIFD